MLLSDVCLCLTSDICCVHRE